MAPVAFLLFLVELTADGVVKGNLARDPRNHGFVHGLLVMTFRTAQH